MNIKRWELLRARTTRVAVAMAVAVAKITTKR
jgi:hypothetical protein